MKVRQGVEILGMLGKILTRLLVGGEELEEVQPAATQDAYEVGSNHVSFT